MTTNNETVGFIGLGIMGLPMARNVLKGGYPVVAWNRTASKVDLVADAGAERGESPSDVAARSTVIVTCVRASEDVEQVVFGQPGVPGIIDGVRPGSVVIDMSTISPAVTRQVAAKLAEKDVAFIDAPISGGEQGAISGTLSIMCGGPAEALDRVRPVLETMGKRITHCGDSGAGQTVKLCNQIAVVLNNLAMAEALVFCQRSGVDPSVMLEAIAFGAAGSWQMENRYKTMNQGKYDFGFAVDWMRKDLGIVLDTANATGASLPVTALVDQFYKDVQRMGGNRWDTSSLLARLERE